jgi:hypothetical protein
MRLIGPGWRRRDWFWLAIVLTMALVISVLATMAIYYSCMLDHYRWLEEHGGGSARTPAISPEIDRATK